MRIDRLQAAALATLGSASLGGGTALHHGFPAAQWARRGSRVKPSVTVCIVLPFFFGLVRLLTSLFAWKYHLSNMAHACRPSWQFSWPIERLIRLPSIGIVIALSVLLGNGTKVGDPYPA